MYTELAEYESEDHRASATAVMEDDGWPGDGH